MKRREDCSHFAGVEQPQPRSETCEECGSKLNLRVCLSCGHVGCCESQYGHNTKHARATGHPIIRSLPLSPRSFTWCYECNDYVS